MDWDDEYDFEYETNGKSYESTSEQYNPEEVFSPIDIANPKSAYFLLSDDVQDELNGSGSKKMKCRSCEHRFRGEIYDNCPKCFSASTDEIV